MRSPWSVDVVDSSFVRTSARVAAIVALAICTMVAPVALARSWRVELDGLGDFLDIQPAVEAAAPGDTILIGPGRFDQLHEFVSPGWTGETVVSVTRNDLTFIGAGADRTFIGKNAPYRIPGQYPTAIWSLDGLDVTIQSMSIENMYTGIYWYHGIMKVEDCAFRGLVVGMTFWPDGGHIRNCLFGLSSGGTALAPNFWRGIEIESCRFVGAGQGISAVGYTRNLNVSDCVFEGNHIALRYESQSTGLLRNVTITGASAAGIVLADYSDVTVDGGRIDGGEYGIMVASGSSLAAVNLVNENTTIAAFSVASGAMASVHQSHVLPAAGHAVLAGDFPSDVIHSDFTGNWWGTEDPALIANLVFDMSDDPDIHCIIDIDPIANGPVPAQSVSWSTLKAGFR